MSELTSPVTNLVNSMHSLTGLHRMLRSAAVHGTGSAGQRAAWHTLQSSHLGLTRPETRRKRPQGCQANAYLGAASAQPVAEAAALIAGSTDALLQSLTVAGIIAALAWSALPIITGEAKQRNQPKIDRRLRQVQRHKSRASMLLAELLCAAC